MEQASRESGGSSRQGLQVYLKFNKYHGDSKYGKDYKFAHVCSNAGDLTLLAGAHYQGLNKFQVQYPQADREPAELPALLLDMLLVQKPDWTSQKWAELWGSIFRMEFSLPSM